MHQLILANRPDEARAILELIDQVRDHGAALVIRGDAGIGKSTLLAVATEHAQEVGMVTISVAGAQTESHLPFAGLHALLLPFLAQLQGLPVRQRSALEAAFGISDDAAPDLFLIALATLDLLGDAAASAPLLMVVDDAQWLDRPTADVLSFVARRLNVDPIVLLIAVRDYSGDVFEPTGVSVLRLGPLDPQSAAALLDERAPGLLPAVRDRLLHDAAGNPLALIELPGALTSADDDYVLLPAHLSLGDRLEQAFAARFDELPDRTRQVLLVAAADETCDAAEALAAATLIHGSEVAAADLTPALAARLVEIGSAMIQFRHPLVRSAIYCSAPLAERLAAHRALAEVMAADADRRVWHRASSTLGTDEAVAADLEDSAARARHRGAAAVAVAALERAAALSDDPGARSRRLLRAAELAYELGRPKLAVSLVGRTDSAALSVAERGRMTLIRELVDPGAFGTTTRRWLIDSAQAAAADGDLDLALEILWLAANRSWWSDPGPGARQDIVDALDRFTDARQDPRVICALGYAAPEERGAAIVAGLAAHATGELDAEASRLLGTAAIVAGAWDYAPAFLAASVAGLRSQGRLGHLPRVLVIGAMVSVRAGDWIAALPANDEARNLALETGQGAWVAGADAVSALHAALRGDLERAAQFAAESERIIAASSVAFIQATVQAARGAAALAAGHHFEAYDELWRIFTPGDPAYQWTMRWWSLADLVEAAIHSGNRAAVEPIIREARAVTAVTPAFWHHLMLRHALALLAEDDTADALFREALAMDLRAWPLPRAQLLLAHGVWLRRHKRIGESRAPLRAARDGFDAVGAASWCARARQELRATGETSQTRRVTSTEQLSPQELQIAQMAAAGMTNREIGQELYLSHRTVSSHLYRVFPKLGITSRAQLRTVVPSALDDGR